MCIPSEVLSGKTVTKSVTGTIAQLLARDAIFSEAVMVKCTPQESRMEPSLPRQELLQFMKLMFELLPECHVSFEAIWSKCMTAIEQACKRGPNKSLATSQT